jgi:hypothetical protein
VACRSPATGPAAILVVVSGGASTLVPGSVDAYVARLDRALAGPRRVRADLIAEARDGLVDATEALQARGLDRRTAERRAVAEFGPVDEIAAAFRSELGIAQARRTLVIFAAVLLPQPIIWAEGRWPWNSGEITANGPVVRALDLAVESLGGAVIVGTVLALAVCGIGLRWRVARRHAVRATALFVLAAWAVMTLAGIALTLTGSPDPAGGLLWLLVWLVAPMGCAGVAAHRCLRLA